MSNKQHINGILTQYVGRRDEVLADLDVYLRSPVGVGEHSGICLLYTSDAADE